MKTEQTALRIVLLTLMHFYFVAAYGSVCNGPRGIIFTAVLSQ